MDKKDLVSIRIYQPGDRNFILATWLRGLYYGDSWFSQIPKDVFMAHYHKILERFIDSPTVFIQVACLKDDPEVILGYSVSRPSASGICLDWIFTKAAWRGIGLAKSLVPNGTQNVSHLTKVGKSLLPKIKAVFNPFL